MSYKIALTEQAEEDLELLKQNDLMLIKRRLVSSKTFRKHPKQV